MISKEEQLEWFLPFVSAIESPDPAIVSNAKFRAILIIRFMDGADQYGDRLFRKSRKDLQRDRVEELADAKIYQFVDLFGDAFKDE